MARNYAQHNLGPPTSTDESARANLSGHDPFDTARIESRTFHSQSEYHHGYSIRHIQAPALQIPSQDGYQVNHQFSHALHNLGASDSSLHYTVPNSQSIEEQSTQQFEIDPTPQRVYESLETFSPITSMYNVNSFHVPYPDSNATPASSTTSPDPVHANLTTDSTLVEADEDKRKRNQAASARFRQKKKQREQQLVDSSRDMQERTKRLEAENDGLRKENTFLKKLLVEKLDHMTGEDREMLRTFADSVLDTRANPKS